jgi:hypothetical protein
VIKVPPAQAKDHPDSDDDQDDPGDDAQHAPSRARIAVVVPSIGTDSRGESPTPGTVACR